MTNKERVMEYMEAFGILDHVRILSCLTDDVEWVMPGHFHHRGKAEFDGEIENDAFTGRPHITVSRLTEENDVVIAEGTVLATMKNGTVLKLVYCDVFEMQDGLIRKLDSYVLPI